MRLHISRSAQKDIDKSYAYYYEISSPLAGRFIKAIDKAFLHILDYPDAYPLRYKNFRSFVMYASHILYSTK